VLFFLSFCNSLGRGNKPTDSPAMRELRVMNTRIIALCFLAVSVLIFSGCTTTSTTAQTQTDPTNKRVHTQEELRKTGETNPAAALEKVDPAVRMTGSR
jgi:hypothetical protein